MKKKISVVVLAAMCALIMGCMLGCNGVKYYDLTYTAIEGLTYHSEVLSGAEVKAGYTVRFSIEINREKLVGDPEVKANGATLTADADGMYSFTMKADTVITVDGVFPIDSYRVTFDEGDPRHVLYEVSGVSDVSEGMVVTAGESVRFRAIPSVYYVGTPTVLANTTELTPDAQGYYTVPITANTNITVSGLTTDTPYTNRANGGYGTQASPYIIERPIDLYMMASEISGNFALGAAFAYYKMTQDIDMHGEQLYIIGDATTESSAFSGHFDGDGHTISNYYIDDEIIEQANFTSVFLPYQGLFGYVVGSNASPAEISNVHLRNFEMRVESYKGVGVCTVGALVGYGQGVQITGCSATEGSIVVDGADNGLTYVGGLVGVLQSVYVSDALRYYSSIRSCSTDVAIANDSGLVYAAGGIAGTLLPAETNTPVVVVNSYATGDVTGKTGAFCAGGLVGQASAYSYIGSSYATGDVLAYSPGTVTIGVGTSQSTNTYSAYAGGLVGLMECNTVATDSFAIGTATASAVAPGNEYHGEIAGYLRQSGSNYIEDVSAYMRNCFSDTGSGENWYKDILGWEAGDWIFDTEYPTINYESSSLSYLVTLSYVNGAGSATEQTVRVEDTYLPLNDWYLRSQGIPQFIDAGNMRSYGYYFDAELKQKVPDAFMPTKAITLFAGFADYRDVAGVYYLQTSARDGKSYISLEENGVLTYRNGALNHQSYYTYDGTYVWLYNTVLGEHFAHSSTYFAVTFRGEKNGNLLAIDDLYSLINSSADSLSAYCEREDFRYGEYYLADNKTVSYIFHKDGTGLYNADGMEMPFLYTFGEGILEIVPERGAAYTATLSGDVVTEINGRAVSIYDAFAGTWEIEATAHKQYTFDGCGNWTYEYYGYDAAGQKVPVTEPLTGTYTIQSGVAHLSNGVTAAFVDGWMTIGNETYYAQNSYVGTWVYNQNIPIRLTLDGIGSAGYGTGEVDFGGTDEVFALTYEVDADGIATLYFGTMTMGTLRYARTTKTLVGSFYSIEDDALAEDATFCLYDDYRGIWLSADTTLGVLEFNGWGNYDLAGTKHYLEVRGSVRIGEDTDAVRVPYTVVNGTLAATFTYKDVAYTLQYNRTSGDISVSAGGKTLTLRRRDDWYGFALTDAEGRVYSFDGRGNLTEGGTMSVSSQTGETTATYTYRLNGTGLTVSGSANGSLTAGAGSYALVLGSETRTLYVYNRFGGDWIIGGTENGTLHIGNIGPDGSGFSATGTYCGSKVTFTYDRDTQTLMFVRDDFVSRITTLVAPDGVTELRLTLQDGNHICVKADADYFDDYRGVYVCMDSQSIIRRIVLDGLSNAYSGIGTAIITEESGVGSIMYSFDAYNHLVFRVQGNVRYIFVRRAGDVGAFKRLDTDETYDLVVPDVMYGRTVYGLDEDEEADLDTVYIFDGVSSIYTSKSLDSVAYTYELHEQTEDDKLRLELRATFTDSNNKKYNVVINYGSTDFTLTMQ